jgi:VanZ family protein
MSIMKRSGMKFVRYWLPAIVFASLIFGLSSIPGDGLPQMPIDWKILPAWIANHPDKIAHGLFYSIFGWLCLRAVTGGTEIRFPLAAIISLLIASGYGASDECHQFFVPHRSCDIWDWVADSVGSSIAIAILYPIYSRKSRTGQSSRYDSIQSAV